MSEHRSVPFRDRAIRVSRNYHGQLHICATDVCDILKRSELLKHNKLLDICPSAMKMAFRRNGREHWAIRPSDMHRLIQMVRRETTLPRELINELEEWNNRLLEIEVGEMQAQHYTDSVAYFTEEIPVTFRRIEDKLMVNATQITMPYGKIPSEWLRVASTDHLRRKMAQSGATDRYEFQIFTTRGRGNGATWIESPLIVSLARWIAPDSGLAEWCEEQIEKFEEKHHQRQLRRKVKKAIHIPCLGKPMPEDMETAVKMIDELRGVVREMAPKSAFYDDFIENREWFKSTRIADELNTSSRHLHRFLMEQGICKFEKSQWIVLPAYRSWQCDVPYTWENAQGKVFTFGAVKRWTHIGREGIIELWNKMHPEFL